jgi:hypothetical protein
MDQNPDFDLPKKPAWLRKRKGFASRHFDELVKQLAKMPGRIQAIDADAVARYAVVLEEWIAAETPGDRAKLDPALDRAMRSLELCPASRPDVTVSPNNAAKKFLEGSEE